MSCAGHRPCSPVCKRSRWSPVGLCLLCWNTGCQIPTRRNSPTTIDEWIESHRDEQKKEAPRV